MELLILWTAGAVVMHIRAVAIAKYRAEQDDKASQAALAAPIVFFLIEYMLWPLFVFTQLISIVTGGTS